MFDELWLNFRMRSGAQVFDSEGVDVCRFCRSRRELSNSNEYLLAAFGVDTAENEPLKVCQKLPKS